MKKRVLTLFSLVLITLLTACNSSSSQETIKLGVVGEDNEVWEFVQEKLKDEDIDLEIVKFSDYNQPNLALEDEDIDLNAFQHKIFLDNFNEENNTSIVPIADTVIAPLGIYSDKLKSVEELKENDKIAIPNDVTNGGRALLLLQTAGLIKVDDEAGYTPVVDDITENELNLEIIELDATQTSRSLADVAVAVINSGIAVDAGFLPVEDAIFLEPIDDTSAPYINIIAKKEGDERDVFQKIIEAYQSDDTIQKIEETSKGSSIPTWK